MGFRKAGTFWDDTMYVKHQRIFFVKIGLYICLYKQICLLFIYQYIFYWPLYKLTIKAALILNVRFPKEIDLRKGVNNIKEYIYNNPVIMLFVSLLIWLNIFGRVFIFFFFSH